MVEEQKFEEPIQEQDELGVITGEQQLQEYENDVVAYTKALEDHQKGLDNYEEQLKIDKGLWEILRKPNSVRKLNPSVEYEKDPKWAELMHQKQLFQIRADEATAEGTIEGFNMSIERTEKALKSAQERLTKFKKDNIELIARMKRNGDE